MGGAQSVRVGLWANIAETTLYWTVKAILPFDALIDNLLPGFTPTLVNGSWGMFSPKASPLPRFLTSTVSTRFASLSFLGGLNAGTGLPLA